VNNQAELDKLEWG